jgi:hypothetical protein
MAIGGGAMIIFDYVAIGVLIVLLVWAVAELLPRGKRSWRLLCSS